MTYRRQTPVRLARLRAMIVRGGDGAEAQPSPPGVLRRDPGPRRRGPVRELAVLEGKRMARVVRFGRAAEVDIVVAPGRRERRLVGVQCHELARRMVGIGRRRVLLPDVGAKTARETLALRPVAVVRHRVEVEPGNPTRVVEDVAADPVEAVLGVRMEIAPVRLLGRPLRERFHRVAPRAKQVDPGDRLQAHDSRRRATRLRCRCVT